MQNFDARIKIEIAAPSFFMRAPESKLQQGAFRLFEAETDDILLATRTHRDEFRTLLDDFR